MGFASKHEDDEDRVVEALSEAIQAVENATEQREQITSRYLEGLKDRLDSARQFIKWQGAKLRKTQNLLVKKDPDGTLEKEITNLCLEVNKLKGLLELVGESRAVQFLRLKERVADLRNEVKRLKLELSEQEKTFRREIRQLRRRNR